MPFSNPLRGRTSRLLPTAVLAGLAALAGCRAPREFTAADSPGQTYSPAPSAQSDPASPLSSVGSSGFPEDPCRGNSAEGHRQIQCVGFREDDADAAGNVDDTGISNSDVVPVEVATESSAGTDLPAATVMDLGTVLSLVGGQHPAVGFAKWRVQQAYAEQIQASSLWLPSIQAGISFHNHTGNLQASNGTIQDVNRSSLQAGFGTGAVGAGTTPNPGLVARFHLADAMYAPSIAEKNAWAQGHAVTTALNDQLLEASLAWLELLTAEQRVAVLRDSLDRTTNLAQVTQDFFEAGQGLLSDAERMTTEKSLARNRLVTAMEQSEVAGARLVQAVSASGGQRIVPAEQILIPVTLVDAGYDAGTLISQGLHLRPELKEAQCLVAAACEQYQRQKYAPFVPSVLLGASQTGFGGGVGSTTESISDRMDFDAALTWELRGLGYGEQAARRITTAQVEQARFRQVQLMDRIAREITEAHTQTRFRFERIAIAEQGITSAEESVRRNLDRIRNGQGRPIEALQAIRALEEARLALVTAISDYNAAQFRLHRAIGHPVCSSETP
ncbi:MAG: TolC family protein [Planctomycetaceae bacterium]|nr:TolC family protein [Planctomycetaceae bacterium]